MYSALDEQRKEDFKKSMREYGVDPKQILDNIEQIVADVYRKKVELQRVVR